MLNATIMTATLTEDTDEGKNYFTRWASTRKLELEKNKDAEPEKYKLRIGLWMELSLKSIIYSIYYSIYSLL
jgi:hypothetical protein